MFSVVIPLYNKELSIRNTLESVLNQTFKDFEVIIVNDGSTDKSLKKVKGIKDERILIINQKNGGVSSARNRGIKEAKNEWIAFLDADDLWEKNKLQLHANFHQQNPDYFWSCSGFDIKGGKRKKKNIYRNEKSISDALLSIKKGLTIWTSTVVVKRKIFEEDNFLFNEGFQHSEDREVWYKLGVCFPKVGYIQEVLASYRIHQPNSLTTRGNAQLDLSFLSVEDRIKKSLSNVHSDRQQLLSEMLKHLNLKLLLGYWCNGRRIGEKKEDLQKHFPTPLLNLIIKTEILPTIVKKLIYKSLY